MQLWCDMAPKHIFFKRNSEGYPPSPAAEAASSSHMIWPDSESTEERPLPGDTMPVYSDILQEVQLTDNESEVEAAKRAADRKLKKLQLILSKELATPLSCLREIFFKRI